MTPVCGRAGAFDVAYLTASRSCRHVNCVPEMRRAVGQRQRILKIEFFGQRRSAIAEFLGCTDTSDPGHFGPKTVRH